ncbi:MAG TPA: sensor histidine kinase [Candidatus Limiplasma sp.]|nr:sensor histidine kinase [Candidatus Limiplasma sp.]
MKHWIRRSFKTRIFYTVLLVSLLPLVICDVIMLPILIAHSETKIAQESRQQMALIQDALSGLLEPLNEALPALAQDEVVRGALTGDEAETGALYPRLFQAATDTGFYAGIGLFDAAGVCRYAINGIDVGAKLYVNWGVLRAAGQTDEPVYADGADDIVFYAAQAVRDAQGSAVGYVVFAVNETKADQLFSILSDTSADILLLNASWEPLYSSQPALGDTVAAALRQQLWDGKKLTGSGGEFAYFVQRETTSGYFLVVQKPKTFTATLIHAFYFISILKGALCLLLCFWGAWLLSRHLSRPIRELNTAMGAVERGHYAVRLKEDREDELGKLAEGFNRMTREYSLNLQRSVQRQKELNDTRLRMMQAQLNPHFLYNTLDVMKWLGTTNNIPVIAAMATDLAFILRSSITGNNLIPLQTELDLVEHYVNIQNVRFEDRFTCEIDVPEAYQRCLVPKLVLQPLVENAILHGVAGQDDGYIKLSALQEQETLVITVADNGCGMSAEVLDMLNSPDKRIHGGHLGLYNVDRIIKLYFGNNYGITAQSGPEGGSRVSVRLPMTREEANDAQGSDR